MALLRRLLTRFVPQGGLLLSALFFGSFVMGLLRTRVLGQTFGGGAEQDAYIAAFYLPELALDVLVESGLAAPFVPIFLQLRREGRAATDFGQTILTGAVLVMTLAAGIMFIFAPQTTALIAPGFDGEQQELYVSLFRLMLLTPIIFGASIAVGGVLVAERRFLAYGSAPIVYNAGIVLGTLLLADLIGIYAAAVGAILGALLHLGVRIWGVRNSGFRVRPRFAFRTLAVRDFVRLMIPKMVSQPLEVVTSGYFTRVATTIGVGSVTAVSIARDFQAVPATLIGASFALAAFPTLSAAYAASDRAGFMRSLRTNLLSIGVLTAGAGIVLFLLGGFVIERILGGGEFGPEAVARTSLALSAFALAIPFESLGHLLSRAIYATRNTLLQVVASLAGFGVTIFVTSLLAPELGLVAIPLGFVAGTAAKLVLL
ncbi:MAG: murein biosynthesis integral membrane protein MurJ, partial [Candidatus Limnocylindria bacterium]